MLKRSTIQLLRFHFSFFLMPVYWFALGQVVEKNWFHAILIFIILHLFIYPASNGYNSYMDRDTGSIGGLRNPSQPTRQLFIVTAGMDLLALLLCLLINIYFTMGVLAYILASRAYSYRKIRLKKYPVAGYLTVVFFQGGFTFLLVYFGSYGGSSFHIPFSAMVASSLLVGGFYPLTQIYQHQADREDNVRTLSYLLGYRGTFIFVAIIYLLTLTALAYYFFSSLEIKEFFILASCMIPIVFYFFYWAFLVWKNSAKADYIHTMRMNILASFCTNLGFIIILLLNC